MAFTFFFRDVQSLETIRDHVIPSMRDKHHIRIWDAGCAKGAEPYTLAILLRENMGPMIFRNLSIHATDIDTMDQFCTFIKDGVYPAEDIKRIPEAVFDKYFSPAEKPDHFVISAELRNRMSFEKHDLLTLKPVRTDFNVVVCKNVLLHFKQEERIEVIKMFYDSLADGGYFVTEHTQKLPVECNKMFEQVLSNVQLYRKLS